VGLERGQGLSLRPLRCAAVRKGPSACVRGTGTGPEFDTPFLRSRAEQGPRSTGEAWAYRYVCVPASPVFFHLYPPQPRIVPCGGAPTPSETLTSEMLRNATSDEDVPSRSETGKFAQESTH